MTASLNGRQNVTSVALGAVSDKSKTILIFRSSRYVVKDGDKDQYSAASIAYTSRSALMWPAPFKLQSMSPKYVDVN
jgi:hypothetical protein